jgi:hypothetical protein
LRLEKSAIAAPTLDGIAVVHAQGSTLACMNPDPLHQPLPPRRHERLTDVVVAHMPPGSTVAPRQSLPHRRRAHLMGPPPRACPRDPMPQSLPPRRRARLRDPPSRTCPQIRHRATDAEAAAAVAIAETDGTTVVVTGPRVRCCRPSASRAPSPLARLPRSVVVARSWWSAAVGRLPRDDTAVGPQDQRRSHARENRRRR